VTAEAPAERVMLDLWLANLAAGRESRLTVRSGSMAPLIRVGELLVVGPPRGRPRPGDLVVFVRSGQLICHRLVWPLGRGRWREKGDLSEEQGVIRARDIVGTPRSVIAAGTPHSLAGGPFRRWNPILWLLVCLRDLARRLARVLGRDGGCGQTLLSRLIASIMARIRPEGGSS
jgi:hypothetical protein